MQMQPCSSVNYLVPSNHPLGHTLLPLNQIAQTLLLQRGSNIQHRTHRVMLQRRGEVRQDLSVVPALHTDDIHGQHATLVRWVAEESRHGCDVAGDVNRVGVVSRSESQIRHGGSCDLGAVDKDVKRCVADGEGQDGGIGDHDCAVTVGAIGKTAVCLEEEGLNFETFESVQSCAVN